MLIYQLTIESEQQQQKNGNETKISANLPTNNSKRTAAGMKINIDNSTTAGNKQWVTEPQKNIDNSPNIGKTLSVMDPKINIENSPTTRNKLPF